MPAENPSADNVPCETSAAASAAWRAPGEADYEAICAAVMATERGRWFLSEYARRNRQADTAEVLAAIERIAVVVQTGVGADTLQPGEKPPYGGAATLERLRAELADMANAIVQTRAEFASIKPNPANGGELLEATAHDGVVRTAERATSDILAAAEQIQAAVWTMREQGLESQFCDRLDRYATEICAACSWQERGTQWTRRNLHVLRYLEIRIQAMIGMFGAAIPSERADAQPAPAPDATRSPDDLVLRRDTPLNPPSGEGGLDEPIPDAMTLSGTTPVEAAPALLSSVMDSEGTKECADPTKPSPGNAEPMPAPPAPVIALKGTTLTIEGPKGSFSIVPAPAVEPPVPTEAESKPSVEPDSTAGDIRAFAWDLAADDRMDDAPLSVAQTSPASVPPATPSVAVETTKPPAAAPIAVAGEDDIQDDADLLLTVAPRLGDMPQRSAPEPAAAASRRKTDIAEDLFADVMALSEEERIALFT
jgi:hypothetical protein